jgi:hypothetical protein
MRREGGLRRSSESDPCTYGAQASQQQPIGADDDQINSTRGAHNTKTCESGWPGLVDVGERAGAGTVERMRPRLVEREVRDLRLDRRSPRSPHFRCDRDRACGTSTAECGGRQSVCTPAPTPIRDGAPHHRTAHARSGGPRRGPRPRGDDSGMALVKIARRTRQGARTCGGRELSFGKSGTMLGDLP